MVKITLATNARELREHILREREKLVKCPVTGSKFMQTHSNLMNSVVSRILSLALEEIRASEDPIRNDLADGIVLAATGGWGREELAPFSDIDITFVVADPDDAQLDLLVRKAYRLLMDVFLNGTGLKIGYSYRAADDTQDLPLDTLTSLLDARRIVGSEPLFDRFYSGVLRAISPALFISQHLEERSRNQAKWGGSPYTIEANIKEGCGGLRDIQTARWIAQAAFNTTRVQVWETLRSHGIVSDDELKMLRKDIEFLSRTRNALHKTAGRGLDVISLDRRDDVTEILGFKDPGEFMAHYFEHAEHVNSMLGRVAAACDEQSLEIEPGLVARNHQVHLADFGLLSRDPAAVIRVFDHAIALKLEISRETEAAIHRFVQKSAHPHARKYWKQLSRAFLRSLSEPEASRIFCAMNRAGVLQWIIPEFGKLMHLAAADSAHVLTVGAHSLETVRHLESFSEDPEMKGIFDAVSDRGTLFLSALLHDIGKSENFGNHAQVGAKMAEEIAMRLGMHPDEAADVRFLVLNHLLMADTARMRDLNQKKTLRDFAAVVQTPENLDLLYLLTAADIRSVGQKTWSEVQMSFLRELYNRADTVIRGLVPAQVDLEKHRGRIARELSLANLPGEEVEEHCRLMPAGYLLNTPPDELAAHIVDVRSAKQNKPVIRVKDRQSGLFTEVTICAKDDPTPGLLSRIALTLAALDVDIHAAQVFTRESSDRIAIDILYVDCNHHTLTEIKKLSVQSELEKVLDGRSDAESLIARFGKKLHGNLSLTDIKVISNASDLHTVIEVYADDQPGLLYRLAHAISHLGWNIHSARVSTWGSHARDAFYVTDTTGAKLPPAAAESLRKAATVGFRT
jgi:[protein-PII] uridylyltransferase